MAYATNADVDLYYEREGDGPTVAFVPTAGYGAWQWAWQAPALAGPFETVVPELRGTGRSDAPPGPYDIDTLVSDLDAILSAVGADRVHLVGQGLGGVIAMEYANEHGRARSLTLLGTPDGEQSLPERLDDQLAAATEDEAALRSSLDAALSAEFRGDHPDAVDRIVEWRREDDATLDGWRAQADALAEYEREWPLYELPVPALVVHGTADEAVPIEHGRMLGEELPAGTFEPAEGAGHLVGVERSGGLNDRLFGFLEEQAGLELELE